MRVNRLHRPQFPLRLPVFALHSMLPLMSYACSLGLATDYCSYSTPMFSEAVTPQTTEPEEKRAPSPGSAFYTPSLDAYMEPRLNVGGSHQRARTPTEESYPVFSPPPYPAGAPVDALQYLPEFLQNSGFSSLLLARYPFLLRFRRSASAPSTHHACNQRTCSTRRMPPRLLPDRP
ncbi:hypothetical protein AVEN_11212-1 [Araneus ventricosus]|uniref:Uncharacterized protein n=1 Tax=Araneus ventricosus TaxID=182803 RepID=A0A4Y2IVK6_ARAVE|nr:hypothetical protein AVEN_11212-1 [Araneus ventricosus]